MKLSLCGEDEKKADRPEDDRENYYVDCPPGLWDSSCLAVSMGINDGPSLPLLSLLSLRISSQIALLSLQSTVAMETFQQTTFQVSQGLS